MSRYRSLAMVVLAACLLGTGQPVTAAVTGALADTTDASILTEGKSGAALVAQLERHVNEIGGYKYDALQEARVGGKVVKATGTFYFRPTNAVRMEVKDYGSKSGSILVKSPDGTIKGKGGARMLGITLSLTPDSRLLRMPNGLSALDCDLISLLNRLKKQAAAGCKIVVGEGPIKVDSLAIPVIVIESQTEGKSVVDRVYIDPAQKLPLQWDLFENGAFQSRSSFQNYQTNAHWDESQFSL